MFKMPQMDKYVDKYVKTIDSITEPHEAWRKNKQQIYKGSRAIFKEDYITETPKGPLLDDKVKHFARDLYTALGEGGNLDDTQLHANLRRDLGQQYGPFREALKVGRLQEVDRMVANALETRYKTAVVNEAIERIGLLPPDDQVQAYKELVGKVGPGTDDYVLAAQQPDQLVQTLDELKLRQETFRSKKRMIKEED